MPERHSLRDATSGGDHVLEALLARVAGGDLVAFSALHAETVELVYAVARRVLLHHEPAEDVTQEVFLEVWEHAGRYDPARGEVGAWLTTISRNRALSKRRGLQAQAKRDRRHGLRQWEQPWDVVSDLVAEGLQADTVRRDLLQLTPVQLQAVVLHYYYGYTVPEIARRLEIPLGTAKTRIRDGVVRLRRLVDEQTPPT